MDVTDAPTRVEAVRTELYGTTTGNLLRSVATDRAQHHVVVSLVGADRVRMAYLPREGGSGGGTGGTRQKIAAASHHRVVPGSRALLSDPAHVGCATPTPWFAAHGEPSSL
ncbi:hypothetical protein [Streptomyces sp. DSM 118878]